MRLFSLKTFLFSTALLSLAACSTLGENEYDGIGYKGQLNDPIMVITLLSEQQREWGGTPYVLGGNTRNGVDCSGFTRVTFIDRFNIQLPRTTTEQSKYGKKVPKNQIQTGDLVFFKTGRGPNGYHVGIYVKDDKFLHASTKGGVIYSSLNNPYWLKTFWQVRRI
ncbi:putative lipoprotein NlpC [Pasteurella langaaensis DSM 22999]|uniref:Putative lipoprotein NlpC n=1 Tax=Alitibacter langaaensis DSM 22999 TaxID=1122935 RepID=A0A2U0SNV7_9PAST|nr:NlpC/P60 family protein [Pasteurella langaaensis]PVX33035.1 putative lipoprotein NlpC [Pasteurella langaaensis DSM 22999]